MFFQMEHKDKHCEARTGKIFLEHGVVEFPVFMPVGTQASVKALTQEELEDIGTDIILCNAYHLYLRPGLGFLSLAGYSFYYELGQAHFNRFRWLSIV
jgi:queuine tRNA-ribosyltransferase